MTRDGVTINELSKMANVTVRTIRFYTDEGVLDEPAGRGEKVGGRGGYGNCQQRSRQQAAGATSPKVFEVDRAGLLNLTEKVPGDQVARNDKEDVHAHETTGEVVGPEVKNHHRDDGECTQSLNIDANVFNLGGFAHRPSLIGDCYEQSETCQLPRWCGAV